MCVGLHVPVQDEVLEQEHGVEAEADCGEAELGEVPGEGRPVRAVVRHQHHLHEAGQPARQVQQDVARAPATRTLNTFIISVINICRGNKIFFLHCTGTGKYSYLKEIDCFKPTRISFEQKYFVSTDTDNFCTHLVPVVSDCLRYVLDECDGQLDVGEHVEAAEPGEAGAKAEADGGQEGEEDGGQEEAARPGHGLVTAVQDDTLDMSLR